MVLQVLRPVLSESVGGLAQNELVDKVGCLHCPLVRDFILPDLYLLGQYVVSDFFAVLALVWTLAEDAFIPNDADSEVVDGDSVGLPAHDFGGHLARRPRSVFTVVGVPDARDAEVSYTQVASFVKYQILRLDVSVQDAVRVQKLEAEDHACDEELGLFLREAPVLADMVAEVATLHQVNH